MSYSTIMVRPDDLPTVYEASVHVDGATMGDVLRFDDREHLVRWHAALGAQLATGETVHPPRNERPTSEAPAVAPVVQRYCPVHDYTTHTVTSTGLRDRWACAECGHVANDPQRVEAVPA